ncbi:MAG: uroporphyrinogen-III synthase [Flavobacteriales bacterium]|nr:uroporphyrinogen-III synthase [Flavobacteriales bacterium]
MRSIFISRDLPLHSLFRRKLEDEGWTVHAQSLINIVPIRFTVPARPFQWVFFSSSHGADLFLHNYEGPKDFKVGVVGTATAEVVRTHGIIPDFVGESGDMLEVAHQLKDAVGDETVLFAGAEHGSERVKSHLSGEQKMQLSVYRTEPDMAAEIPDTDVVYLTSPSNAKAYLARHRTDNRKFSAIGTTTADYLKEHGVKEVSIPKTPQQKHVLRLLLSL